MKADRNSENTAFEIIRINKLLISLRSLINGKILSTVTGDLTFVDYLSETEKFYVCFDPKNFIGIFYLSLIHGCYIVNYFKNIYNI